MCPGKLSLRGAYGRDARPDKRLSLISCFTQLMQELQYIFSGIGGGDAPTIAGANLTQNRHRQPCRGWLHKRTNQSHHRTQNRSHGLALCGLGKAEGTSQGRYEKIGAISTCSFLTALALQIGITLLYALSMCPSTHNSLKASIPVVQILNSTFNDRAIWGMTIFRIKKTNFN